MNCLPYAMQPPSPSQNTQIINSYFLISKKMQPSSKVLLCDMIFLERTVYFDT